MDLQFVDVPGDFRLERDGLVDDGPVLRRMLARLRNLGLEILADQTAHPVEKIAEVVGEIAVETFDKRLDGEAGVLPEDHLAHQIITYCVDAVLLDEVQRTDHVAQGFAHLGLAHQPPAVGKDGGR